MLVAHGGERGMGNGERHMDSGDEVAHARSLFINEYSILLIRSIVSVMVGES